MKRTLMIVALLTGAASARASAQSTARVGEVEKLVHYEISAGASQSGARANEPHSQRVVSFGVRWDRTGSGGIRLMVHGVDRSTTEYLYGYVSSSTYHLDTVHTRERAVAVLLATDATHRLFKDLVGSVSFGAGAIPFAHGTRTGVSQSLPFSSNYSTTQAGVVFTAGVLLRYRWLFVEKSAYLPLGANQALRGRREYFPWSAGVRF